MARLICAGLAVCDLLLKPVDREVFDLDAVSPKVVKNMTGGDALNATVNLSKLGVSDDIRFVGVVGDDMFGRFVTDSLKSRGIDCSCVVVLPDIMTSISVALIESNGERHFVYDGTASNRIEVEHVLPAIAADTEFLHIGSLMTHRGLEHEHLVELFSYCHERGIKTSFDVTHDSSGEWFGKIKDGLPYTDTFFASYEEAIPLSGGLTDPEQIAEFFRKAGAKSFVLKLGKDGCYVTDYNGTVVRMSTYSEAPRVDTTGAGDAFVSGYLFGMLKGLTMEECCVLGNVNGSLGIGAVGATAGTGTLAEVKAFIKEHGAKSISDVDGFLAKF